MERDLGHAALGSFDREWEASTAALIDLERCFTRMAVQTARLAEAGCHMHLVFPSEMQQKWWVAFQEGRGDLIPVHPEDAPMMPLET